MNNIFTQKNVSRFAGFLFLIAIKKKMRLNCGAMICGTAGMREG
jgi:hypothetical protein